MKERIIIVSDRTDARENTNTELTDANSLGSGTHLKLGDRQARRMMERMGINMKEMPDVEEVIIRTGTKDIHVRNATVSEVNAQGNRVFQVVGEVEEIAREKKTFNEEDILLVQQQANVTREKAQAALEEADGEVAKAILKLTS